MTHETLIVHWTDGDSLVWRKRTFGVIMSEHFMFVIHHGFFSPIFEFSKQYDTFVISFLILIHPSGNVHKLSLKPVGK